MTITLRDISRYNKALERASCHNSFGKYRIVTRLYRGSSFIGEGSNYYQIRRDGGTYHPSYSGVGVHAELDCVSRYSTRRSTLYIAGLSRMGFEIVTRPCPRCSMLLSNTDLHWVVYNSPLGLVKARPHELI